MSPKKHLLRSNLRRLGLAVCVAMAWATLAAPSVNAEDNPYNIDDQVDLTVDAVAPGSEPGTLIVSGTLTCDLHEASTYYYLQGVVRQKWGHRSPQRTFATFARSDFCIASFDPADGYTFGATTQWSAVVDAPSAFHPGKVTVTAGITICGDFVCYDPVETRRQIRLSR